jgi:hypothetical protein
MIVMGQLTFPLLSITVLLRDPWCVWQFAIQRFSIFETTSQELRPGRNQDVLSYGLGQQVPQLGMMPAQFVAAAVAMRPNAGSQPPDLRDKFIARKGQ